MGSEPLKRYEAGTDDMGAFMRPADDGKYVLHSDAAARIAELEEAVRVLAEEVYQRRGGFKGPSYVEQRKHDTDSNPTANAALEAARRTK